MLVTNPKELEAIRQREADITKEKIAKILAAGANVILTTKVCWRCSVLRVLSFVCVDPFADDDDLCVSVARMVMGRVLMMCA